MPLDVAMIEVSKSPWVLEVLKVQGTMPSTMNMFEAEAFSTAEHDKWMEELKKLGIQPQ